MKLGLKIIYTEHSTGLQPGYQESWNDKEHVFLLTALKETKENDINIFFDTIIQLEEMNIGYTW